MYMTESSRRKKKTLTLAMSHTVTRSQAAARSKLCTLFFTLRAILQSPQPKSATTREKGLEYTVQFMVITLKKQPGFKQKSRQDQDQNKDHGPTLFPSDCAMFQTHTVQ